MRLFVAIYVLSVLFCFLPCSGQAADPPVVPIGMDAYRQWERWPYQRIGVRAYMRSTCDRSGGNEGVDASHFLYQLAENDNVTLDVAGPGILYFARYNHWHGSPWRYVVDGKEHIVQETSSATPDQPQPNSVFLPEALFPNPLAWTWSVTRGSDLSWVPLMFTDSFRMGYSRTRYGTGYYIYHQFVPGTRFSSEFRSWDGVTPPAQDVLTLINRAGSDLAPRPGTPAGDQAQVREHHGEGALPATATLNLFEVSEGPTMLRAIELSVPRDAALAFSKARLRATWDGRAEPSIDAPVALLFGAGVLYNRDDREYLVKAFPVNIRYTADRVHLACYFPMPFFRSARIELVGTDTAIPGLRWSVRSVPYRDPANEVGYFHATYRDFPTPVKYQDMVLLDTTTCEGGGDWSGSFIGTSFIFSHAGNHGTLEGDPRFFFDDSQTPQGQGTGTEEWGGGGDYWGGRNMTIPFAGHPVGGPMNKFKDDYDKIESAYRFLLADLMPFGRNARITLEHGPTNESRQHYEAVTYWYGLPAAALLRIDTVDIGDHASETAHDYRSPDASAPYLLTSRYELGVDAGFAESTDQGRVTKGTSEFTLALDPRNLGVLLRRTLDYQYPNQRAEVSIAVPGTTDWKPAGIWYVAGSNTGIYSNPTAELGETQHVVQTSNRRFRDDEFLLPRALCEGRSAIRVRLKFTPVERPLLPGKPLAELGWSEMRYTAYCYVMPEFALR